SDEPSGLQWFSDRLGAVKSGPLATLCDGFLATATYTQRTFRLLRAWPCSAADCSLYISKRKNRPAPGDGSLMAFYRERYGLEVTDPNQCVLEAGDGIVLRPAVAAVRAPLAPELGGASARATRAIRYATGECEKTC
ncbi:unnamed protein product, partial [Durusdinium trenchii]